MAPKAAAAPKAKAASGDHASYQDMIKDAIINLKDRSGSSRVALKKYVKANNKITAEGAFFDSLFNRALKSGVDKGVFAQPKGSSGGTKLAAPLKKEAKPKTEKKAAAPKAKKAAAPKKTAAAKPKAAPKAKKAAAPKEAKPKATKAKAAPKPKKAAAPKAAPAIVEKPAVLGKTKSGRVTKTTSKTATPKAKKAAAPKKPAVKKATPKKAAA